MIERRQNLPLVTKALDDEIVVEARVHQLNGDPMLELTVGAPRFIDRAHSSAPDLAGDAIGPGLAANHRFTTRVRLSCLGISNRGLIVSHASRKHLNVVRTTCGSEWASRARLSYDCGWWRVPRSNCELSINTMPDLLVNLLKLPPLESVAESLDQSGIVIRRAQPFEITPVRDFIKQNFSVAWADEVSVGFARRITM